MTNLKIPPATAAAVIFVMAALGCDPKIQPARPHDNPAVGNVPVLADDTQPNAMILFDGNSLGQWQVTDFIGAGDVLVRDGSIILNRGEELTGVTFSGPVIPNDYEITIDAMRLEGEDFFCGLTFPVGKDHCTLIVGGWHGKVVGLSNIDLMDAAENETTVLLDFETGRWYRIRLRVTPQRIRTWIDADKIIDVPIAGRIIDVRYEVEPSRPLGIASWQTTAAIRNITLRPLTPPQSPK